MTQRLSNLTAISKLPFWLGLAALVGAAYLAVAAFGYGYSGFPLDDGWIHQTYARNLGQRGEFAFTPGVPSTGSTSPLWTLLLSIGYASGLPFQWWTYGLGIILLGLSGFTMASLGQRLFPGQRQLGPLVGLALVLEWHLSWAAVSGMETILFVWLSILLVERYLSIREQPTPGGLLGLGLLGGLLTLTRPEGIGLAGLLGLEMGLLSLNRRAQMKRPWQELLIRWALYGLGLLVPLLPYLWFNYTITGLLLPNTFYAKQQEYGLWLKELFTPGQEFFYRLRVYGVSLVGMQILLLPGLVRAGLAVWRQRLEMPALLLLWWLSYLTVYAIRLPVTYQHGRYQIPVIPWILLLGFWGSALLLRLNDRRLWPRVLSRVMVGSLGLVLLLFTVLGSEAYARDVRFIETEMVVVAYWLRDNTSPDTIIATHDIGAIGYYTERPLVDLAGLITPEVIPFIRNQEALLVYAISHQADYLVTFPSWYPLITASLTEVYKTNSPWSISAPPDNMTIYRLP